MYIYYIYIYICSYSSKRDEIHITMPPGEMFPMHRGKISTVSTRKRGWETSHLYTCALDNAMNSSWEIRFVRKFAEPTCEQLWWWGSAEQLHLGWNTLKGQLLDSSQIPEFWSSTTWICYQYSRYSQTIEPWNFVTLACHEVRMSSRTCLPPSKPPKKKKPNSQIRRTCSSSSSAVFMHILDFHIEWRYHMISYCIVYYMYTICWSCVEYGLTPRYTMVIVLILCSYFYYQFKGIWRHNLKYFVYLHSGSIWASKSGIERLRLKRKKDMMLANMSLGINTWHVATAATPPDG